MPNTDDLNRTLFISDNLPFLQALDTESVDLVVIDPPFGKNQTFVGNLRPPLTDTELEHEYNLLSDWGIQDEDDAYEFGVEFPDQTKTTATFSDIWNFRYQITQADWDRLDKLCRPARHLIEATRYTHSESTAAYITFMTMRMLEIRRILKSTGSVYLHCDHAANAYLRQMMDAVFEPQNFRNEIVWRRTSAKGLASTRYPRNHDVLLYYSKGEQVTWNRPYRPHDAEYVAKAYRHIEPETGRRYRLDNLANPNKNRPNLTYEFLGVTRVWRWTKERMEAAYRDGLIVQTKPGGVPSLKRYLDEMEGSAVDSIWEDIQPMQSNSGERTGYPTQKPQALARRIIETSSKPGDLVLDCFAGCAYVPVAAEQTERRWIACDMSPRAWTVVRRQFHKQPDLRIVTEGEIAGMSEFVHPSPGPHYREGESVKVGFGDERIIRVRGPHDLPQRTTTDGQQTSSLQELPPIEFRQHFLEDSQTIWKAFVDHWGAECWYCGQEKQRDRRELQFDHIEPNKRDGSNDDCWNRALACVACNSDKGDRLTVAETMDMALKAGRIETPARRNEQAEAFERRHHWAKERWEEVRA